MPDCVNSSHPIFKELRDTHFNGDDEATERCILSFWESSGTKNFPKEAYISKWLTKEFDRLYNADDIVVNENSESEHRLKEEVNAPVGGHDYREAFLQNKGKPSLNITRENLIEIKENMKWTAEKGESVSVTNQFNPLKGQEAFKTNQHAANGTIIHRAMETIAKHISDVMARGGELTFHNIRAELERISMNTKDSEGVVWNMNFADGAREKVLDSIAEHFEKIANSGRYEFMDAETRIKYDNPIDKKEYRGSIDLILKDKQSGGLILCDYKTSSDPGFTRPDKWMRMSRKVEIGGESKYDKTQLQLTAYQMFMEQQLGEGAVVGRVLMPFTLVTNEHGQVTDITPTKISGQAQLFEGGYILPETPQYFKRLHDKYGMDNSGDISQAAQTDIMLDQAVQRLQKIHKDLQKLDVSNDLLKGLKFSFNEMGLSGSWGEILNKTGKFLTQLSSDVKASAHDASAINNYRMALDDISKAFNSVKYSEFESSVLEYADNVLHLEGSARERFINENLNACKTLEKALDVASSYTKDASYVLARKAVDDLGDYIMAMHKDYLPKYLKIAQANLKSAKMTPEVEAEAYRLMKDNVNMSDIERLKENLLVGHKQTLNDMMSANPMSILSKHLSLSKLFMSAATSSNPIVQSVVHKLMKATSDCKQFKFDTNNKWVEHANEIEKASDSKVPKDMYQFMLNENVDDQGKVTGYKVVRMTNEQFFKDQQDFVDKGGSREAWFNDNTTFKDLTKDTGLINRLQKDFEGMKSRGLNVPDIKEKPTNEELVTRSVQKRLLDLAEDLHRGQDLTSDELNILSERISKAKSVADIREEVKIILGKKGVISEKSLVVDHLNLCLDRSENSLRVPKDEKYIDPKYNEIMSRDDSDPQKKMFIKWWETVDRYDDNVSEVKRLGNDMPSVYLGAREGKEHFWEKSNSLKPTTEEGKLEYKNQQEKIKRYRAFKEEMAENSEFLFSVPLRYSGRELPVDHQSFDFARMGYLLETSLHEHDVFGGAVSQIEMLNDEIRSHSANTALSKARDVEAQADVTKTIAKLMDKMVYHTPQMKHWALNAIKSYMKYDVFVKMAASIESVVKSHWATTLDTQLGIYGQESGFRDESFLGRGGWLRAAKDSISHMGGLRNKSTDIVGKFLDQTLLQEGFHGQLEMEGEKGGVLNTLMKQFLVSDNWHKRMLTATMFESEKVFNEKGEAIRLVDNLKIGKDGKVALKDEKVFRSDGSGRYYNLDVAVEKLKGVFNRTIHSVDQAHQASVTLDEWASLLTAYKKLAYSGFEDAYKPTYYNITSGEKSTGSVASITLGAMYALENALHGHTMRERLSLDYFEGKKSLAPEQVTACRRGMLRLAFSSILTTITHIWHPDKDASWGEKTLHWFAKTGAAFTGLIGQMALIYEGLKFGGVAMRDWQVVKDIFGISDSSDEKRTEHIIRALPIAGGAYQMISPSTH